MKPTIHLGADHAGYALKEHLKTFLQKKGYLTKDWGAHTLKPSDDYPDYAKKVALAVQKKGIGILLCGTAEGICIAANKIKGIRAVPIRNVTLAKLSRQHNDANVLCLAGGQTKQPIKRLGLTNKQAEHITLAFLTTPFSNEKRHLRRIHKIKKLEQHIQQKKLVRYL